MKPRKRAPRLSANERRAEAVQTVLELAAQHNPSDITTTTIADRMKMTQGALFRHFPTKDAIWQAVMEWVTENMLARVNEAAGSSPSPLAGLEAIFHAHIGFVVQHPGVPRMLFGELQRAGDSPVKRTVRTLLRQYNQRLQKLIKQGQAEGEIAPEVDPSAGAALFVGMVQGLVLQSLLTGKEIRMRKKAVEVFAVYLRGIRRTP